MRQARFVLLAEIVSIFFCTGVFAGGDVTGDGKVTLAEAIHALQVVAGLKPSTTEAPLGKSGQTSCHDAGGDAIPCTGTGQDGDLQRGVAWPNPRFADNGDDTVTDRLTGLMWTRDANLYGYRTWTQALADCEACALGGYDDWHLPNRRELFSLLHDRYCNPALSNAAGTGQWTPGDPFTNVNSSRYWSSTTHAFSTGYAWTLALTSGYVDIEAKGNAWLAWCVRGGPD